MSEEKEVSLAGKVKVKQKKIKKMMEWDDDYGCLIDKVTYDEDNELKEEADNEGS